VVATVGTVSFSLDLARRNGQPFLVSRSENVPSSVDYFRLYRLAVFLIAATEPPIVRAHPVLIKVVVDLCVLRRVMVLRERWRHQQDR
jgi:hypothetical protein